MRNGLSVHGHICISGVSVLSQEAKVSLPSFRGSHIATSVGFTAYRLQALGYLLQVMATAARLLLDGAALKVRLLAADKPRLPYSGDGEPRGFLDTCRTSRRTCTCASRSWQMVLLTEPG